MSDEIAKVQRLTPASEGTLCSKPTHAEALQAGVQRCSFPQPSWAATSAAVRPSSSYSRRTSASLTSARALAGDARLGTPAATSQLCAVWAATPNRAARAATVRPSST